VQELARAISRTQGDDGTDTLIREDWESAYAVLAVFRTHIGAMRRSNPEDATAMAVQAVYNQAIADVLAQVAGEDPRYLYHKAGEGAGTTQGGGWCLEDHPPPESPCNGVEDGCTGTPACPRHMAEAAGSAQQNRKRPGCECQQGQEHATQPPGAAE
jgi:hypothetical protein